MIITLYIRIIFLLLFVIGYKLEEFSYTLGLNFIINLIVLRIIIIE